MIGTRGMTLGQAMHAAVDLAYAEHPEPPVIMILVGGADRPPTAEWRYTCLATVSHPPPTRELDAKMGAHPAGQELSEKIKKLDEKVAAYLTMLSAVLIEKEQLQNP